MIKTAAIVGLGAIGCIYARRLLHYMGDDFAVIAGGKRAERIRQNGETINGEKIMPKVVEPGTGSWKADLVIVSVKNYQLDGAIEDIRDVITPDTVILTIINGVSARDKISAAYPDNTVLYGLSRSDASRTAEGVICTWEGAIDFGEADNTVMSEKVKAVKELFDNSGIKSEVCPDMLRASWLKFMRNVSMNQLSALLSSPYGGFFSIPELNQALIEVMQEVVKVAKAKGIDLRDSDIDDALKAISGSDPEAKTSMLQDMEAGRRTEVDSFAGVIIEEGKKAGVPTPWNHALCLLIKSREQLIAGK